MLRYILSYDLKRFQRVERKLLALEKTHLVPEIGNLRKKLNDGIMILLRQKT